MLRKTTIAALLFASGSINAATPCKTLLCVLAPVTPPVCVAAVKALEKMLDPIGFLGRCDTDGSVGEIMFAHNYCRADTLLPALNLRERDPDLFAGTFPTGGIKRCFDILAHDWFAAWQTPVKIETGCHDEWVDGWLTKVCESEWVLR